MRDLIFKIAKKTKKTPSIQGFTDWKDVCRELLKTDDQLAIDCLTNLSNELEKTILDNIWSDEDIKVLYGLHKKVLLLAAPYNFDSYLMYTEWNREPEKKFYPPRRKVLKQVVDALQDLADDKLDLLAISLPPGSGKTTLAIFYLTWLAGRFPDEPMLTGSHSNSFVRGVYDECLRILDPNGEYLWKDVFPGVSISNTNAKDCRIDIGKRKRFETLEFTSIGTGNAGLYRASRLLYCDDLVSGIEVALSKERLDKLWETYTTDLRQRKIGDHCKELHIATRWSVHDVIGRLESDYGDSERAKFIVIPALDDDDKSNFDYDYGVGFNTKFYHEQREIMEDASWRALYMNQPIEREGLLYSENELRRYFELPEGEPDAILSVCDTKDRGTDYCAMPIVYQYGNDYYVEKIICDNSNPEVVETRLVMELIAHKVQLSRFESNSAGGRVAQKVQEQVKAKGGRTKITTKYTTSNKETKIIVNSPFIKEHCLFKDDTVIGSDKEYRRALQFLCSYTMAGKNKHDDIPDAFAQLSEFIQSLTGSKVEVFKRPF
jgi:predicted phage terminase large subunit-like protein